MINSTLKKNCMKVPLNPYRYVAHSVGTTALVMILLLSVQLVMLLITKSYASLIIVLCTTVASVGSEAIHYFFGKNAPEIHTWRISFVQGFLMGLLVPSSYPPIGVFFVALVVFLVGKYVFGEFSDSWANIVALGICSMYFVNAEFFPKVILLPGDLQNRNAALTLIQSGAVPMLDNDPAITDFLNRYVFKFFGVSIPNGYVSLFWDNYSLIPAFRFNFITLVSSIILLSLDMIDYIAPAMFILVYGIMIRCLEPLFVHGIPLQGDIIAALLTSGTLFSTVYLLQWYGTTPISVIGKTIYGFLAGVGGFFTIGFGTSPIGYMFTILFLNLVSPIIQIYEDKYMMKKVKKTLLPKLKMMKEAEND